MRVLLIEDDKKIAYVLRMITPLQEYNERVRDLPLFLSLAVPLTLIITSLANYYVSKSSLRPLTDIADTAERISGHNLNRRLSLPKAQDEIKQLAESLNLMMDRIELAFVGQRQFIANASHELHTPLTIINCELEYAKRFLESAKSIESIEIARGEVVRLPDIADQLLMLVKIDSGKLILNRQPTRLDELLAECVKAITNYVTGREVAVNLQIDHVFEIMADGEKLKSALLNILDNAIKYSNAGGEVIVSLSASSSSAETAIIKIVDGGGGIAKRDLPSIFDRFYCVNETRPDHSGSELGLAIVKEIIELHNGKIAIESEENRGTTVIIELPSV